MLLLTPAEMGRADRLAADSGIDSYGLMVKAGRAVAAAFLRLYPEALRADVFCGPGNNGGDGYIAAEALKQAGVAVALFHLGDPENLKGDARRAFQACSLDGRPLEQYRPTAGAVIIDALFGAGLQRPLSGALCTLTREVSEAAVPVIAVDLPSGISGLTGKVMGAAFRADHTVTFMRAKPGHYLLPGREHCGRLEVFDIGIPQRILEEAGGAHHLNGPDLFAGALPAPAASSHKFKRGHLGVFSGGPSATGAARLSATSGLRIGAGLVTLAVPPNAAMVVATQVTAVMVKTIGDAAELAHWLEDSRLSAFVLGPGFGIGEKARAFVSALAARPLVLDADGISSFAEEPDALFALLSGADSHCVLTPHEGEFARLFPDIAADEDIGKPEKAKRAAERANAVVLYKGADTVIAAPDGRIAINADAPPWLATAGSGDVLAGIIGGLLAQGMPAFDAACAGAWLHGEAGNRAGEGLTAEDLPNHLPPLSAIS